jgi:lysozyme
MTLRGIDVSHYQKDVDWHALKAKHQLAFGVFKATEGLSFVDPKAARNRAALIKAGLAWGGYHYAHPELDCNRQVDMFLRVVQPIPGELRRPGHRARVQREAPGPVGEPVR